MTLWNPGVTGNNEETGEKWFNSPVALYEGSINDIRQHIPSFERRDFFLPQHNNEKLRTNVFLDTIVRLPTDNDKEPVPVGVVSKGYSLIPHTDVLDVATDALNSAGIKLEEIKAKLKITKYGERMSLSLFFPGKYHFDPGDSNPMALRLECVNSVDGSTRLRALMGWFRFICSNGLVIGVTRTDIQIRHIGLFEINDIAGVLASGLREVDKEKKNFERWYKKPVTMSQVAKWSDEVVRKAWGFKAATRAYHIARSGVDVEIDGQYKNNTPTTIPVRHTNPVPGTPSQSRNLFHVSQALAWLAKERRDLQEQLAWQEQIPGLMQPLDR